MARDAMEASSGLRTFLGVIGDSHLAWPTTWWIPPRPRPRIASLIRSTSLAVASAELLPFWPVLLCELSRSARRERPALFRSAGAPPWGGPPERYRGLSTAGKKTLVDEPVLITGYHRKSVLRALNRTTIPADGDGVSGEPHRHHRCRYGPEVREALVPLWDANDRLCGKRLQALLPLLLESLEHHGHLALDPEVREKLLTFSSATIDRLLAPVRKTSPGNEWLAPTTEGQLRSMERCVKEWRTARAERLLASMRSAGKGAQTCRDTKRR